MTTLVVVVVVAVTGWFTSENSDGELVINTSSSCRCMKVKYLGPSGSGGGGHLSWKTRVCVCVRESSQTLAAHTLVVSFHTSPPSEQKLSATSHCLHQAQRSTQIPYGLLRVCVCVSDSNNAAEPVGPADSSQHSSLHVV